MTDISYKQELLRKTVHLSSLWIPALILFAPRAVCVGLFALLLSGNIVVEYGYYKRLPFFVNTYGRLFSEMLRDKETKGGFRFSGSPYVLGAALAVSALFPTVCAACAMTVMLISDTVAALIGRPFGKHKINQGKKSVEGALAFFAAGALVVFGTTVCFQTDGAFLARGLSGVFAAMFAEVYENRLKIDDNLSIPLIVGAFLSLPLF